MQDVFLLISASKSVEETRELGRQVLCYLLVSPQRTKTLTKARLSESDDPAMLLAAGAGGETFFNTVFTAARVKLCFDVFDLASILAATCSLLAA